MIKIGVLNISDRASAGIYEDTPGQACVAYDAADGSRLLGGGFIRRS